MAESMWRLEDAGGVRVARCAAIEAVPGVAHAFSTRVAFGRNDFDLGPAVSDASLVRSRREAFLRSAGMGGAQPAGIRQVHGGVIVNAADSHEEPPAADGVLWVDRHGAESPVPAVVTADCVAVLAVDRKGAALAALHAGWRGAAAGIAARAVARFRAEGVPANDLIVALGPAILGCCYEVGEDVVTALRAECGLAPGYSRRPADGRVLVDLHAALACQLVAAGVAAASIHAAPWCTRCRTDLFFSFRGEGRGAGRLMAAVGPAVGP